MYPKKLPFWVQALSICLLLLIGGGLIYSFASLDYDWDFAFLLPYLWDAESQQIGLIGAGIWGTLSISFWSILFGSLGGLALGLLLVAPEPIARNFAYAFVDIFRNTPVLVQLYVMYFIVGTAFDLSPEFSGTATLSLFCAAFIGDLLRAHIVEFDRGQRDAALAMGLHPWVTATRIMGPQILRKMLPALVGQFVSLVKDSSLVSIVSVNELTKTAATVVSVSFRSFETWFLIACIYCLINYVLSSFGRYLENRLRVGGRN